MFSAAGFIARYPMSFVGLSTIMLTQHVYGSYRIAGIVNGCGIIGFAVAAPFLSRMVERYGQARIMRPSLLLSILCTAMFIVVALSHGPVWVLCLLAAGGGAFSGSIGAMVRSRWSHVLHNPRDLKTAFALEAALDEVVSMTGPIIATVLITAVWPAIGMVMIIVFSGVGGMWLFSQKATEPEPTGRPTEGSGAHVMRSGAMWAIGVTFLGAGFIFGTTDVAIVRFTKALGQPSMAGVLLALMATGSLVGALFYGSREWRMPLWTQNVVGMGVLAAGITLLLVPQGTWMMALALMVPGLAVAPILTNGYNVVEHIVPRVRLTESLTWMNTFINVGLAAGSSLGGTAVDQFGYRGSLAVGAIAIWVTFIVALLSLPVIRRACEFDSRGRRRGTILRRLTRRAPSSERRSAQLEADAGVVNSPAEVRRVPTSFNELEVDTVSDQ